ACSSKPSSSSAAATTTDNSSKSTETKAAEDNGPLKSGSQGAKVEALQKRLQELGYYNGTIDGDFGEMTETAFKLFQKQAGLFVDGIAGADADALYADDAPAYVEEETAPKKNDEELAETGVEEETPTEPEVEEATEAEIDEINYSLGDYSDEIVTIQERLNTLGYLETQPDGEFGAQTETAVKSFQNMNELTETGVVDETTYNTLFSDEAVEMPVQEKAEEDNADDEKADEKSAGSVNAPAVTTPSTAPNTEVEKKTAQVSAKSLAGVTNSVDMQKNAKTTNYEFILWLGVMIVVMLITFAIVFTVEKKKQRKAAAGRRFY
ncbi:MAG: peptidoglycan-binding protein, partial [Ruminococcus sp.]|nr:peptidoglycan-binding protein [Ruminococcus sp.]